MSETRADRDAQTTARLEAFSDGVFAIAITLLILDIRVPRRDGDGAGDDLLASLLRLWPSLLAYLLSFTVILVMWVNHHRIFTIVRRTDEPFLFWNGLLLMFVTFVPFPTSLLSEYMGHGTHEEFRIATVVYAGHGFLIALVFNGLWRHAVRRLITGGQKEREAKRMSDQYRWGPLSYFIAFALAFISPWTSVGICLALAAFFSFQGFAGRG